MCVCVLRGVGGWGVVPESLILAVRMVRCGHYGLIPVRRKPRFVRGPLVSRAHPQPLASPFSSPNTHT